MKRILSFAIALLLVLSMLPWQSNPAEATNTLSLAELQAKFPDGKYWNHYVDDVNSSSNYLRDQGKDGFENTVTSSACWSHSASGYSSYVNHYDCNRFDGGTQCVGFARKLAYDAYGTKVSTWDKKYAINDIKPGDVVHYTGDGTDSTNGHTVFVTAVSGSTITVGECNWGGKCLIKWGRTINLNNATSVTIYSAPYSLNCDYEIDTRYPTAFGAYTLLWNNTSDGKTWVSQTIGGENTSYISNGYNGEDDHCIIEEVYTNGWCKVTDIPGVSGARYCPLSVFVNVIDGYTPWWITAPKWAQTYRRWDTGSPQGYIDEGDSVCVISETETMYQVIFPTADGNLCRWVVKCDLGHSYKSTVTVAGCNTQGYTTYRCSVCGTSYKDSYTEATGHCHTSSVTAPTCTEQGYTTYTCTVCGESYIDSYTEAMGHSYSYSVSKEPTQDVQGTLTGQCGACADTVTVSLPKLNTTDYTYKVTKEPSYTATGTGRYTWKTTTYGTFYFEVTLDKLTATLTKIEVASKPTKMVYEIGESLDTTGLTLKATYSDGSTEIITSGFTTSGFDSSAAGEKTVTVTYGGKTTNFTITVEESEGVDPDAPQIVVSDSTGMVGQQVNVTIALANNPGVVSMMLSVGYDDDVLTLVSVTDGGQLGTAVHSDNYAACPYTLTWANDLATENYTYNGEIVTLTFEVSEDAQLGQTSVTIYYDYDNFDIFNVDGEEVWFEMVDGSVNVIDVLIGDVNSDGKVNTQDRMILTRYLAKWTGYTEDMINMTAADVNCDGKVNTQDRMILTRYLAKWKGYEELPYSG